MKDVSKKKKGGHVKMQMEAETISMLMICFFVVTGICLVVLFKSWFKSKDKGYIWFVLQFIFLYLSFFEFLNAIKVKPQIPEVMLSEENSLALGITGVLWTASMFCMLMGVWFMEKRNRK